MKLTKQYIDNAIKAMNKAGYYYDGIESSPGYLRFTYIGGTFPLVFGNWQEVNEFIENMEA